MNCGCHDEPAYWQKDKRMKAGGWWECPRKRKRFNATRQSDPDRKTRVSVQRREAWHAPGGGYVKARLRTLSAQRADILERLKQLDQEATVD